MKTPPPHPPALIILLPIGLSTAKPDVVDLRQILGGHPPRGKPHLVVDNTRSEPAP